MKAPAPDKMDAAGYDERARGLHRPLYDYYARKIRGMTGVTDGVCLDVGSGGGYLGLMLARITNLRVLFLDKSPAMLLLARSHIAEDGLSARAGTIQADVHRIPLSDGSIDLVISRGSMPFWAEPAAAFKEIFRSIAPGGKACIGVGRGSAEVREEIAARARAAGRDPDTGWPPPHRGRAGRDYDDILERAGIATAVVCRGEDGTWIKMWKEP